MISTTFSDKAKWIGQLADVGFPLIPYAATQKMSYDKNWQNTEWDPLISAADLPENYGVVLIEGVLVVDIDPRNYRAGESSFKALLADLELNKSAFDTFTVRSGAGGLHMYFKVTPGLRLRSEDKEKYPGIEMKLKGRQVVGPGSVHPKTGKTYVVERGEPARMLPAPLALLEYYKQAPKSNAADTEWMDDAPTRRMFSDLLTKRYRPAVAGQSGDPLTVATAMAARDLALPEETAYDLMLTLWNDYNSPPWEPSELRAKIASAYKSASRPVGWKHPSAGFTVVDTPGFNEMSDAAQYGLAMIASWKKLQWDITMQGNQKKRYRDTLSNVLNLFRHEDNPPYYTNVFKGLVRRNLFSWQVDFTRQPIWRTTPSPSWTGDDTLAACAWVNDYMCPSNLEIGSEAALERWCPAKHIMNDGMSIEASKHAYHPVRDYLNALVWDGVPRVDTLFAHYTGAGEDDYHSAVSRCFLVAMIARVMLEKSDAFSKAGEYAKHDHVIILEGAQGTGKSTFCKTLGGEWYAELHLDMRNRGEAVRAMFGKWVVELAEFLGKSRQDSDALKAFLSIAVDMERPLYEGTYRAIPRQSVFIATMNPGDDLGYLDDQTGNRRFWPIPTGKILIDELMRDRDQLFAEALVMYRAGAPWHLEDPKIVAIAKERQSLRTSVDAWTDKIADFLETQNKTGVILDDIPREYIASAILNIPARDHNATCHRRIANAMRALGWESHLRRLDGHRVTSYRKTLQPIIDYGDILDL